VGVGSGPSGLVKKTVTPAKVDFGYFVFETSVTRVLDLYGATAPSPPGIPSLFLNKQVLLWVVGGGGFPSGNYACTYMSDKNAFICH